MFAKAQRRAAFSLMELAATMALMGIIGLITISTFSTMVGVLSRWRTRVDEERRVTLLREHFTTEVRRGAGAVLGAAAVSVDDTGAVHVLSIVPPGVSVSGVEERRSCTTDGGGRDGVERESCTVDEAVTHLRLTPPAEQWPTPLLAVDENALTIAGATLCPALVELPFLAVRARNDAVAVVAPTAVRRDPVAGICVITVSDTAFPGASLADAAVDGVVVPVRWRTLALADDGRLVASFNGRPPQRLRPRGGALVREAAPDVELVASDVTRYVARRGVWRGGVLVDADGSDDGDGDGVLDVDVAIGAHRPEHPLRVALAVRGAR